MLKLPLLAFDTSTELLSVALAVGDVHLAVNEPGGAQASARLLPAAATLLDRAGLDWGALCGIAFGRGPGAFTGLRTSCAVAQGLALGLGVPVWPLDSLAIVAEDARAQLDAGADGMADEVQVVVAMDARMGEVYAAAWHWRRGNGWHCAAAPVLAEPAALAPLWAAAWPAAGGSAVRRLICGSALGVPALRAAWPGATASTAWPMGVVEVAAQNDRAAALMRLALDTAAHEPGQPAEQALPLYLRDKVALTTAERAAARKGAS